MKSIDDYLPEKPGRAFPHYTLNECIDACFDSICDDPVSLGMPNSIIALISAIGGPYLFYIISIKNYFYRLKWKFLLSKPVMSINVYFYTRKMKKQFDLTYSEK